MSVVTCGCGRVVYALETAGTHVPCRPLKLETVAVPGGKWQPQPDSRTATPADGWGHPEHTCPHDTAEQGDLFAEQDPP